MSLGKPRMHSLKLLRKVLVSNQAHTHIAIKPQMFRTGPTNTSNWERADDLRSIRSSHRLLTLPLANRIARAAERGLTFVVSLLIVLLCLIYLMFWYSRWFRWEMFSTLGTVPGKRQRRSHPLWPVEYQRFAGHDVDCRQGKNIALRLHLPWSPT